MIEVLLVIVVLCLLAAVLLPPLAATHRRSSRINCIINLKQINLASRLWAEDGDTNSSSLMISETRTKQLIVGNMALWFQTMSNELSTPKILVCPFDTDRTFVTNFADLNNSHISYFVNPDANETYPQMITIGDRNLAVSNAPVSPGLLIVSSPNSISWTSALHKNVGNIGYADGSVSEVSASGLQQALVLSTNGVPIPSMRLAIP